MPGPANWLEEALAEEGLPAQAEIAGEDAPEDEAAESDGEESGDIEIPESGESDESQAAEDEAQASAVQDYLTYTADGQEFKATKEEAIRALSLAKSSRRVFSEKAQLQQALKKAEQVAKENSAFREKWEQAVAGARSPKEVWERLTGQKFDELLDAEMQRRQAYANATPEERKILDYESKFHEMKSRVDHIDQESKKRLEDAEKKSFETKVEYFKSLAEPVFNQHVEKIAETNPQAVNKLAKMLWITSVRDLQEYKKRGYEPNRKMIEKVFSANAAALRAEQAAATDKGTKAAVAQKKETAKQQAQVASTRNYTSKPGRDYSKMNPLELFHALTGKERR